MAPEHTALHSIHTFKQLIGYLRDELGWPIESDDFEELTFDYAAEELGLDKATAAKIKEIKQLRPLSNKQPWGIFFVNFEPKRLPIVALRRILSTLVIKKRQSANRAQQAAWRLHDLLFISSYGEAEHRDITFAHFAEEPDTGDLPVLRLLGWDDEDTPLHVSHVDSELKSKLRWPTDEENVDAWRTAWASAFKLRPREVIKTSQQLALRLADLARKIRRRANAVLAIESEKGTLRKLHAAFKEALIHDLGEDDFADMYAQTISYGLLTARVSRPSGLVADNLTDMVPVTNPFLKELLEMFLTVGGRKGKIDFDELGVNEVVQLLRYADMEAVLRDFGDRNPQEDPVIHFYELFLKEYDPEKRMKRGVFYTPRPVVSFIVRSVDEILRKEFKLEDGLADTTTWGEMAERNTGLQIPKGVSPDQPFVQILDPAVGTGTFLVEAIDVIHRTMEARWGKQGHMALEFQRLWNEYVPKHLLPRLHGFELMMAPYAIAHMKIGLKLFETGYRFGSTERARVYLTNSLEPAADTAQQREFEELAPALAHEAIAVNRIKSYQRFTVVIGNPPYSLLSQNLTPTARLIVDSYRSIDGTLIRERGALQFEKILQDDYVKFFRLAQVQIDETGSGVIGLITNHAYLDNPTLRGMRHSLLQSFARVFCLNLHGNPSKKESAPDGSADENVFDIKQGVAIFAGVNAPRRHSSCLSGDLWGERSRKYERLLRSTLTSIVADPMNPAPLLFLFKKRDDEIEREYTAWTRVAEIFEQGSMGIVTARDHVSIAFDRERLLDIATRFRNSRLSDKAICEELDIPEKKGWDPAKARNSLKQETDLSSFVKPIDYRPFDTRKIFYHKSLVWGMSWPTMQHVLGHENIGLSTTRSVETGPFHHAFVSKRLIGHHFVSLKEVNYLFPLWLYPAQGSLGLHQGRKSNIRVDFLSLLPSSETGGPQYPNGIAESAFNYIYAILNSPNYRARYREMLRTDFPHIPIPKEACVFAELATLGSELIATHLLNNDAVKPGRFAVFVGSQQSEIERLSYSQDQIWLDREQTCGFSKVPRECWEFKIGGYQVSEKWLKDRKGRRLSKADIEHFQKIVGAIRETIRIMAEIDKVIDAHGGWPAAFVASSEASAQKAPS